MTWVCRPEDHAKVRSLIKPANEARLHLLGWMTQEKLRDVYDEHGVFLSPSLFEGFGKVFLEAMARGLCVIGTPTGGMPDVIRSGEDGVLVGFNSPEAIVESVRQLWESPDQMASMSCAAAERAREYSWKRVAKETLAFYQHLLVRRDVLGAAA